MNNSFSDSPNPISPPGMSLNALVGNWDVSETHSWLAGGNDVTLVCRWASGFGKALGEWAFNDGAVLYKLTSEGQISSATVRDDSAEDDKSTAFVLGTMVGDMGPITVSKDTVVITPSGVKVYPKYSVGQLVDLDTACGWKRKERVQWPLHSALRQPVFAYEQAPFQSQAGVFFQRVGASISGSFQRPHAELLIVSGRPHARSLWFETDKSWPCSSILADVFARPSGECCLVPKRVVVVLRPHDERTWFLTVYHLLEQGNETVVIKSVFTHQKQIEKSQSTEEEAALGNRPDLPNLDRQRTTLDIEEELARVQQALAVAEQELKDVKDDLEWCEHELVTLELDSLAVASKPSDQPDRALSPEDAEEAIYSKHREYLELGDRLADQECEVDLLDGRVWELEDLRENGISEWQEARVREAERIVAETIDVGTLSSVDLVEFGYLAEYGVSEDVLTMVRTLLVLRKKFLTAHDDTRGSLDYTPLIGQMAKTCERLFGDAFSARRSSLLAVPEVNLLMTNSKQFDFEIPDEDKAYDIDKSLLGRVLNKNVKNESDNWSGTRNGAIALLLFGRHYRTTNQSSIEIRNPLGVAGSEADRTRLRVALYRLQESRNGFVHHDVASPDDVERFETLFVDCIRLLVELLYSRR